MISKKIHDDENPIFLLMWSNLHERSGIGWIERKTKFPIFPFLYISSYGHFFPIFDDISKNKNQKI